MEPFTAISVVSSVLELASIFARDSSRDISDYGLVRAVLLRTVFVQAHSVIVRLRKHVLKDPFGYMILDPTQKAASAEEAWSLTRSYTKSLNMIAVAGAIVAQIAITALSLPDIEQTHWIVEASFVVSLVAGILSVYFACMVQLNLGSLQGPLEAMQWFTTYRRVSYAYLDSQAFDFGNAIPAAQLGRAIGRLKPQIPSFASALLLAAPSQMLNWSLASLLIGVGIYYGLVFAQDLGSLRGQNSNLAILLIYVIFTAGALTTYIAPGFMKLLETTDSGRSALDRWTEDFQDKIKERYGSHNQAADAGATVVKAESSTIGDEPVAEGSTSIGNKSAGEEDPMQALKALIAAQRNSLHAQEGLMRTLRTLQKVL